MRIFVRESFTNCTDCVIVVIVLIFRAELYVDVKAKCYRPVVPTHRRKTRKRVCGIRTRHDPTGSSVRENSMSLPSMVKA